MFWAPSEEGTELRWIIYVTLPMHPDVRTVATIPEEAIKRLRSLERLVSQRISYALPGGALTTFVFSRIRPRD